MYTPPPPVPQCNSVTQCGGADWWGGEHLGATWGKQIRVWEGGHTRRGIVVGVYCVNGFCCCCLTAFLCFAAFPGGIIAQAPFTRSTPHERCMCPPPHHIYAPTRAHSHRPGHSARHIICNRQLRRTMPPHRSEIDGPGVGHLSPCDDPNNTCACVVAPAVP